MSQQSLEMVKNGQDMAYGSEGGENVRFKQKKNIKKNLKIKKLKT
jgi:hypothetical protein